MDINEAWKRTCKVLLGGELGELESFKEYLRRNIEPINSKKSIVSGENVTISDEDFCPSARFVGNDEIARFEKSTANFKLNLNEIKDIDSIINAVSEKLVYSGRVLLGEFSNIENSHRCTNSHFVKDSHQLIGCKYTAYSSLLRDCEYAFGCSYTGEGKFGVKSTQFFHSNRCFEAILTMVSSDCYYTANMEACQNCMFSFNLKSKSNCIGNLVLPKDKYNRIKSMLIGQIKDELEAKKEVMGIVELLSWGKGAREGGGAGKQLSFKPTKPPQKEIDRAFSDTTSILFGKRLSNLGAYQDWLFEHVRMPFTHTSAKSGKPIHISPLKAYVAWSCAALSGDEAWELGKTSLAEAQVEKLAFQNAKETLAGISYSTSELVRGMNASVEESINYFDCAFCFGGSGLYAEKKCAYSFYTRECESTFGCELLFYSNFCLKCYHSSNLTRCFEVLDSKSCSDCYFCHNCENVHESMFCFNAKNKRYAIGNVEIGRERYLQIKKLVLDGIIERLEKDRGLKISIYNIGCKGRA